MTIIVRELKPELVTDYLNLFDKAFSDFPDWAGCFCGFYELKRETGTLAQKLVPNIESGSLNVSALEKQVGCSHTWMANL